MSPVRVPPEFSVAVRIHRYSKAPNTKRLGLVEIAVPGTEPESIDDGNAGRQNDELHHLDGGCSGDRFC